MRKNLLIATFAFLLCASGLYIYENERDRATTSVDARYALATGPARSSQIVELKDGDRLALKASYVTKTIAGKEVKMLAYNGTIPGPEIHVMQGAKVFIDFTNETDMPTLLHSHGVRMDNAFDGSQIQQKEIPPRGKFTYELKFPDAGIYWYHPHASEAYQQALGLYGAFVVTPKEEGYFPPANHERVLFFSDLPIKNGVVAIRKDGKDASLMGHYGNVFLLNGEERPTLAMKKGEVVRLYVVNAANARPIRFAIEEAKMKLEGGDSGAYERASWQDGVVLGPSERAIVDVSFTKDGSYAIRNETPEGTNALGVITVEGENSGPSYEREFSELRESRSTSASIDPFRSHFADAPTKKLVLSVDFIGMMAGHMRSMGGMMSGMHGTSMGMMGMGTSPDGIEWNDDNEMMRMMNEMATPEETTWKITDASTGRSNMDIHWEMKKDTPIRVAIVNDPNGIHPMQHPIHFHGQRFLVLSVNGVKQTNLVWKDTVLVPAGQTIEILLDPSNPGEWMAHCHIAEHLAAGMMLHFAVR